MSESKTPGGLMGLLHRVGVVEFEADPAPQDDSKLPPVAAPSVPSPAAPAQSVRLHTSEEVRAQDTAATQRLAESIEKVAGHYADFTTNMEALADIVPDESARQRAAINLITKKGVPVTKVLSDIDACLGALEEGNRDFLKVCESQEATKVGSREKAIADCSSQIEERRARVASIQAEIAELQSKLESESAGVREEKERISFVKERFAAVYARMKSAMEGQRALIASFK